MASEVTATKIYVNVAMPDKGGGGRRPRRRRRRPAARGAHPEDALKNRHPRDLIENGEQDSLVDSLAAAVGRVASAFSPGRWSTAPRTSGTNEFRNRGGRPGFEPEEHNPMIGYRGCYRYISNPDLFDLELQVLARVRESRIPTCT